MQNSVKFLLSSLTLSMLLVGCNDDNNSNTSSFNYPPSKPSSPIIPKVEEKFYQTKTPYQPQQDITSYERAPTGYNAVFTESVARHGSRGLSSLKYDLALYNLWLKAKEEGALTSLGEQLGPDLQKMMTTNILLGYGVEGISKPGYGNETHIGIKEHRGIADRLLQRLPELFNQAATNQKHIQVVSSGVDRAVDSAKFFTNELITKQPSLKSIVTPQSYTQLSKNSLPSITDDGVNRFLLYFHSLNATDDLVTMSTDPNYEIYIASQNYQEFESNNKDLQQKLSLINSDKKAQDTAVQVLTPLFKPEFINKLGQTGYTFSNQGNITATAPDGKVLTETGKGKNTIATAVDAAAYLYELYSINGGMADELGATSFNKYMPLSAAEYYAQFNDANDFYQKGPSFSESGNVTSTMAKGLKQDFFTQVDKVIDGNQNNVAVLRFTHAEIMIPLATSFELKNMMSPLPLTQTYNYQNSSWRGVDISPMAANMQWDIYKNGNNKVLVKMLYNEKETLFKPSCDSARYSKNSYFYDYQKLKLCYGIL